METFHLGRAAWRAQLFALTALIQADLDRADRSAQALLARPYPMTHRTTLPYWRRIVETMQDHRCLWCEQRMPSQAATWEHVLPLGGTEWARLTRVEQLFSLRLSHRRCNLAYAAWRQHQPAQRLTEFDQMLAHTVRQVVRHTPVLHLYNGQAYRVAPPDRDVVILS